MLRLLYTALLLGSGPVRLSAAWSQGGSPSEFVPNEGQWTTPVHYWSRCGNAQVQLLPDSFQFLFEEPGGEGFRGVLLQFSIENAEPTVVGRTKAAFGIWNSAAPPSTLGFLVLGFGSFSPGLHVAGFTLYLDPSQPNFLLPIATDADGFASLAIPLPSGSVGIEVFFQTVWVNTPSCGGAGTLSSSNALSVTVQ